MKRFIFAFAFLFLALPFIARAQEPPQVVTDPTQAFIAGGFVVKGEGAAPTDRPLSPAQKRILALRAAKVTALRELAEILDGVAISGETIVKDAAASSDTIRAAVQGMVKGAKVIQEAYDPTSEMAAVYVSISVHGSNGLTGQLLPQMLPSLPPPSAPAYMPPAAPPAQAQPYDALILDIKEFSFKPALINRILAQNGEIIYDPTKIAQNILVERGAGDYTNDVGKAKAILSERGVKNPLIVKVAGVVKFTDVQVNGDDAANIFAANQKTNFLEGAKVVFVLK
ncbi:MAG: hypothetical protein HY266_06180 [Deltaproteobacteria bacterium]|nr:hypothetical protein [Deltaproteobacteria bacterium]